MKPSITYTDSKLVLELDVDETLVEYMKTNESLLDAVSCLDPVIKNVVDQITEGWTELGSHGCIGSVTDEPWTAIGQARRQIALASSDITKKEIEGLCKTITKLKEELEDVKRRYVYGGYHRDNY